jgi:hypothetical protein
VRQEQVWLSQGPKGFSLYKNLSAGGFHIDRLMQISTIPSAKFRGELLISFFFFHSRIVRLFLYCLSGSENRIDILDAILWLALIFIKVSIFSASVIWDFRL